MNTCYTFFINNMCFPKAPPPSIYYLLALTLTCTMLIPFCNISFFPFACAIWTRMYPKKTPAIRQTGCCFHMDLSPVFVFHFDLFPGFADTQFMPHASSRLDHAGSSHTVLQKWHSGHGTCEGSPSVTETADDSFCCMRACSIPDNP